MMESPLRAAPQNCANGVNKLGTALHWGSLLEARFTSTLLCSALGKGQANSQGQRTPLGKEHRKLWVCMGPVYR